MRHAASGIVAMLGVVIRGLAVEKGLPKALYRPGKVAYPLSSKFLGAQSGLPDTSRPFTVLGIETSCDDTAVGIVRSDGVVLADAARSQGEVHANFGGIVPNLAKEAHEKAIDSVVSKALEEAGMSLEEIDAIACTVGPGLEICLRVGAKKAVELATSASKPFVGCHHLEGHCLVTRLAVPCPFPFASLVVSGGHTMIVKCEGVGRVKILGSTLDDALGEAYDKAARMLGLGTGGGPALEKAALGGDHKAVAFPVPMRRRRDMDFSYAGLKTSLKTYLDRLPSDRALTEQDVSDVAASFQHVAVTHLEDRLKRAFDTLSEEGVDTLAVVGGVARNQVVRSRIDALCRDYGWQLKVPPPKLCTDNGVMIAWAAVERLKLGLSDPISDEVYPRWPFRAPSTAEIASEDEPVVSL